MKEHIMNILASSVLLLATTISADKLATSGHSQDSDHREDNSYHADNPFHWDMSQTLNEDEFFQVPEFLSASPSFSVLTRDFYQPPSRYSAPSSYSSGSSQGSSRGINSFVHSPPSHSISSFQSSSGGSGGYNKHVEDRVMPYAFEYYVEDEYSGNDYSHKETSDGNAVTGEYRVLLPDGRRQIVTYTADHVNGYQANVRYEGGFSYAGSQPTPLIATNQFGSAEGHSSSSGGSISRQGGKSAPSGFQKPSHIIPSQSYSAPQRPQVPRQHYSPSEVSQQTYSLQNLLQQSYNPPKQSQQSYKPPKQSQQSYSPSELLKESYSPVKSLHKIFIPSSQEQSYSTLQQRNSPPQQSYIPPQISYSPSQQSNSPHQISYSPLQQTFSLSQGRHHPPQRTFIIGEQSFSPMQQGHIQLLQNSQPKLSYSNPNKFENNFDISQLTGYLPPTQSFSASQPVHQVGLSYLPPLSAESPLSLHQSFNPPNFIGAVDSLGSSSVNSYEINSQNLVPPLIRVYTPPHLEFQPAKEDSLSDIRQLLRRSEHTSTESSYTHTR